jgi:2-polyprenylphenol 6-hydroxylase
VSQDFEVAIVGGGLVGMVAASLIAARGIARPARIAVIADRLPIEPAPADIDLRVFAINHGSQQVLQDAGVWGRLAPERLCPYERMCVWDADASPDGRGALRFDCAELGEPHLGVIAEGGELQWRALQSARDAGITIIEAGVASLAHAAAPGLILGNGQQVRAALIVGADGAQSKVRSLFEIETQGHAYHQDALVAHVRTAKPHQNTAWQRFLAAGPLALLPLRDGRCSIVWSVPHSQAQRLQEMSAAEFSAQLTTASGEVLGRCELTTPVAAFALHLQTALEYTRPGLVLVGDAAHSVHPLAGQGLNLGLADVAALIEALSGAGPELGELRRLRRYERRRKSDNLIAAGGLDGLERLFSDTRPWVSGLRNAGMSMVNRAAWLKRRLARHAMGMGQ